MINLGILQPYVPMYRVPFFAGLNERLAKSGVSMTVLAAHPVGEQHMRGDAVSTDWVEHVERRELRFGGKAATFSLQRRHFADFDGLILPLEGTSVDIPRALHYRAMHSGLNIGLWGHVKSYVNDPNIIDAAIERWQMTHSDHVFAYTPSGRDYAVARGIQPDKVTTVMNSVDTSTISEQMARGASAPVEGIAGAGRRDKTFAFIGGLDQSKRIDFLVQVLDRLWIDDPEIKILVAGRGSQEHLLRRAVNRGQATLLGYADDHLKSEIAISSRAILMPGRIGLVAVESLAMGIPILTTDYLYHAPEYDYLVANDSVFVSPDTLTDFVSLIHRVAAMAHVYPKVWTTPSITSMIDNFTSGVLQMLNGERGTPDDANSIGSNRR
ncbi:glycosyltransferase [Arthrobacter sp. OAP107]|uniref:glycosyltransferase n=1 Tax=Arthrobacter sp. OAP107 TaxID=3156445 RepID=UPI003394A023